MAFPPMTGSRNRPTGCPIGGPERPFPRFGDRAAARWWLPRPNSAVRRSPSPLAVGRRWRPAPSPSSPSVRGEPGAAPATQPRQNSSSARVCQRRACRGLPSPRFAPSRTAEGRVTVLESGRVHRAWRKAQSRRRLAGLTPSQWRASGASETQRFPHCCIPAGTVRPLRWS